VLLWKLEGISGSIRDIQPANVTRVNVTIDGMKPELTRIVMKKRIGRSNTKSKTNPSNVPRQRRKNIITAKRRQTKMLDHDIVTNWKRALDGVSFEYYKRNL
jgi:hypothetical protein